MSKINVGIIGVGHISGKHYEGYKNDSPGRIVAISDVNPEYLEQRQKEWGIEKAYSDYRELLADPNVEAVEVITPHHTHAKIGVDVLEAGKPLSLQKPMAMTLAECDALIDASKRTGTMLRVFENFRYYPPLMKAKEMLDAGEIGEPLSMRMKVTLGSLKGWNVEEDRMIWRHNEALCGGGRVTFDYGYHHFSTALWLLGDVEKVHSWITHSKSKYGVLDCPLVATWKYKDAEKYGSHEAIFSGDMLVRSKYFPEDEWFEITGKRGFIWVNRCSSMLLDKPPVVMYRDGTITEFSDMDTDWIVSFKNGVHDFCNAVIEGRQSHLTGEEGKRVHQFCKAIERSAKENREIKLDEIVSD